MKTKLILASLAVVGLTFAGLDYADAKNRHFENREISELSPVERERFKDMRDAQFEKMRPLRTELKVMKMELDVFRDNPSIKQETISKLVRDIVTLENKIQDEYIAFKEKMATEFDIEPRNKAKRHYDEDKYGRHDAHDRRDRHDDRRNGHGHGGMCN